jgi:hypothetical protein
MDALFDLFLWSTAGMLLLAPPGAAFGAMARLVAQKHGNTPDATPGHAARRGAMSGAVFLGVLGFLFGLIAGLTSGSFESDAGRLLVLVGAVLILMLMAVAFAGLAQLFAWLGVRGTGLVLMLVIVLGFGVVLGRKAGFGWPPLAFTALTVGLIGVTAIVLLRIRSPHGTDAFNPWADDADVIEE